MIAGEDYKKYLEYIPFITKFESACVSHVDDFYRKLLGKALDWWDKSKYSEFFDWTGDVDLEIHLEKSTPLTKSLYTHSEILKTFPHRYFFMSVDDAIADCLQEVEQKKAEAEKAARLKKERDASRKQEKEALRIQALKKLTKKEKEALGFKK